MITMKINYFKCDMPHHYSMKFLPKLVLKTHKNQIKNYSGLNDKLKRAKVHFRP